MSAHITAPKKQKSLGFFFVVGLILIGSFWGINVWLLRDWPESDQEEAERSELRAKNLAELHAENEKKLTTYAWVDREKGTVQIPISQAMRLVVPELNANVPRPAYPIATPAPAATNTAAPAASPTP